MEFNFGLGAVAVAKRALESCQKGNPQTSLTGNVISWNLGPLHLSAALPYIAQTMQKGAAVVLLQDMAQGRVLWLEAKTHDNVSNVHQATAKRHDLQQQVTLLLKAMIDAALTQRRIMGGDFNAALSRYGYTQSTSALFDKVDKFFQDFVHSAHGTLIESEAHTRRDLLQGIKHIARPHHHVEPDVHEHMHNAKLNKQSSLGGCRMQ